MAVDEEQRSLATRDDTFPLIGALRQTTKIVIPSVARDLCSDLNHTCNSIAPAGEGNMRGIDQNCASTAPSPTNSPRAFVPGG